MLRIDEWAQVSYVPKYVNIILRYFSIINTNYNNIGGLGTKRYKLLY
jgi:hypothetical protein